MTRRQPAAIGAAAASRGAKRWRIEERRQATGDAGVVTVEPADLLGGRMSPGVAPSDPAAGQKTLPASRAGCRQPITVVMSGMAIAQSKVTAQGQISVPAEIRKKLGVGPGSVLEWDEHADGVVVRRVGRFSSEDVHDAVFAKKRKKRPAADVKDAIRKYIRKRHARG
jgi:AbrB family looped-hinge helix DNA binding protein